MSVTTSNPGAVSHVPSWRTPLVIIVCGCAIALLSFGPRSTLGFFIQPMSREFAWGRDVFSLAIAVQNLLWGLGQPLAGAIADRFGLLRVMVVGALLYAGGLLLMRYAATPLSLDLGAGVLIGFGLSGCSFNLVLSAFSKLLPPERRGVALGAGTAAIAVSAKVAHLAPGTTYHYTLIARKAGRAASTADATFATLPAHSPAGAGNTAPAKTGATR